VIDLKKQMSQLERLEAESIYIIREVAAEFDNPVMLYSIGKDSSVLLHLARKAFHPGKLPFPLMHIDTTWKFRDMIAFRDRMARELGFDLIVHTNSEAAKAGVPLHLRSRYTDVTKTEALRPLSTNSARPSAARPRRGGVACQETGVFSTASTAGTKNQPRAVGHLQRPHPAKASSLSNGPTRPAVYTREDRSCHVFRCRAGRDHGMRSWYDDRMPMKGEKPRMGAVRFQPRLLPLSGACADGHRPHQRDQEMSSRVVRQRRHRLRPGRGTASARVF
jgi:hypothetical protein